MLSIKDPNLLDRLKKGDADAFRILVETLHPRLVRFVNRLCPPPSVAEEVVQETWRIVIDSLEEFEGRSRLTTWIFQIASNRARTRAVRENRYSTTLVESWDAAADTPDPEDARFSSRGTWVAPPAGWPPDDPEKSAIHGQALEHVRQLLDELPEAQRSVVLLRDVEGLETAEICTILEISPEHARVLLHRGRTRIRRELEALWSASA